MLFKTFILGEGGGSGWEGVDLIATVRFHKCWPLPIETQCVFVQPAK